MNLNAATVVVSLTLAVGVDVASAAALAAQTPAQAPMVAASGTSSTSRSVPLGPIQSEHFRTVYVRLGDNDDEGLLYEPSGAAALARIALVHVHPNGNTFNMAAGAEMAKRGHRVLMVNHHGDDDNADRYAPAISNAIGYLRSLPGVERVVLSGHSGGGHLTTFYQSVAEQGPGACQGAVKILPCSATGLSGLAKADGLILLDSTLGAFHQMSGVDPAVDGAERLASLDMFAAANGYDATDKRASYSAEFARRFHAAQSARNQRIVDNALARLGAITQGRGQFTDDEPLIVPGMGVNANGARLYQPDTRFVSRTKKPYQLLKADGSRPSTLIESVRPPSGQQALQLLGSLETLSQYTTVRRFLAQSAIRTTADFSITADDIKGVVWNSAMSSTPGSAPHITAPALVMTMSCHYLVVPGELVFERLASVDKTYVAVEGAAHNFNPCRPQYGDTRQRTFDYVREWLTQPGRF